ncbi:MAG: thrombospondin type 3 repeat-containing protein [Gammaproteobacteria bacterium]
MTRTIFLVCAVAQCLVVAATANAQTIEYNANQTAATGITGLTVGGTTYDVDFTAVPSHIAWVSMLDVTTQTEAEAIAETIGLLLDDEEVGLLEFDLNSGNVFTLDSVSLWYGSNATSLLGVAIGAPGGWGSFVGSSTAPLNTASPFSIDLTISTTPVDTDEDGVQDAEDNCLLTANADQLDADGDDYGNACDADFDNNCIANALDLGLFRAAFFSSDSLFDLTGDGVVNVADLGQLRVMFFQPPGPSGVTAECT